LPSPAAAVLSLVDFRDSGNGVDYCVLMDRVDANIDGKWDNGY
jgi:hypothetical protein